MANKVGTLIKEARAKAGLSQEALARQIEGLSASDIGKAERGEKELSQSLLRQIAKATGVTQSSLIQAAKESEYTAPAKKTGTAKKPAAESAKPAAETKKPASEAKDELKLTAAEKKLLELYRAADADTKKAAVALLKGEKPAGNDLLNTLLGTALDMFGVK